MRSIALLVVCLWSASVSAAPVTIDFQEFSVGDGAGPYPTFLTSQGYEFSGHGGQGGDSAQVITGINTGGTNAYGGFASGFGQDGFNYYTTVTIEKADGGAFAIHNLDLFIDTDPDGMQEISGTLVGGGFTLLSGVAVGTGDWLNLQSVTFRAQGNGWGAGYGKVEIDNVLVSAVPIPAAVWLLGSGLGLLGFVRRKKPAT